MALVRPVERACAACPIGLRRSDRTRSAKACVAVLIAATLVLAACSGSDSPVESNGGSDGSIALGLPGRSLVAAQGEERKVRISVTRSGGFTGSVTLSLTGAPSGVSASFEPAPVPSDATEATMRLTIGASVAAGMHDIEVSATGQGAARASAAMTAEIEERTIVFERLDVGRNHACAVADGGRAYCWGIGANGRLGTGSDEGHDEPTAVSGSLTFVDISAGGAHTCGVTSSGEGYCWGAGGALGTTGGQSSSVPVQVAGGIHFAQISAGESHTCGVSTDGTGYCWGWGEGGRLGHGSTGDSSTALEVTAGLTFTAIEAGDVFSCGIAVDGSAYCWGEGAAGQLGDDNMTSSLEPVAVAGGLSFALLSLDASLACGVTTSGNAHCWGDGSAYGRLGDGNRFAASVPNPVSQEHALSRLSVGESHVCGVTVDGDGLCWGHGRWGKLGREPGYEGDTVTPQPVWGGHVFADIGAGDFHSCGLTSSGTLYCWGWNSGGRLGIGPGGPAEETVPAIVTSVGG